MADEPTDTTTQGNPQAGTADQPASTTTTAQPGLTAEQVQKMIEEATQKAFNSGAAAARREEKAKAEKAKGIEPTRPNTETTPATQAQPAFDGFALSEAMAEFSLTKDQRKTIRDLASKESPADLDEFVTRWAGLFGAKPASPNGAQANTTAQTQQQTQTQTTQPGKAPSVPGPAPTAEREFDEPFKALGEDAARDTWQAYVRRKGANPANPYDPKNRAAWRELRKQFEARAATASIQMGARRG